MKHRETILQALEERLDLIKECEKEGTETDSTAIEKRRTLLALKAVKSGKLEYFYTKEELEASAESYFVA